MVQRQHHTGRGTPLRHGAHGPDTTSDAAGGTPSTAASGYADGDTRLRGFSPTHLSGAGCPAFGDAPLLPVTGPVPASPATATVGLVGQGAGPGWYRGTLENGVTASLAAADRTGLASFAFPAGPRARLLVKASAGLAGVRAARVSFPSRREVAVDATSGGFCGSAGTSRVHVLYRFDRPVSGRGTWGAAPRANGSVAGPGAGAWVAFGTHGGTLRAQVGVSFVDAAGARRNLATGGPGWSYRALRDAATAAWGRELGRVAVTGGSTTERALLDTALYHVLLEPTTLSDADGRYPGFDGAVHRVPPGHRQYTAIAGWDAYRTTVPLLAWLRPDVASDVVGSLQRDATQGGWLPRWPLVASYTGVMNGDSAAPVVAAARAFGARDFPLATVVGQLARQATVVDGTPGQGWFQPRPGLADYLRLGYVPNSVPERGWPQPHGASTTLEYAIDDFALSRLAAAAGRQALARELLRRSGSWRSLLDPARGLLLPRDAAGALPGPDYDPAACCDGFQEGNAVQYTWLVPQDMAGLLAALGAPDDVARRVDDFHAELNAGAGRPHAWLGDQVSFATPWAYLWLGRPARTQDVVARARRESVVPAPGRPARQRGPRVAVGVVRLGLAGALPPDSRNGGRRAGHARLPRRDRPAARRAGHPDRAPRERRPRRVGVGGRAAAGRHLAPLRSGRPAGPPGGPHHGRRRPGLGHRTRGRAAVVPDALSAALSAGRRQSPNGGAGTDIPRHGACSPGVQSGPAACTRCPARAATARTSSSATSQRRATAESGSATRARGERTRELPGPSSSEPAKTRLQANTEAVTPAASA